MASSEAIGAEEMAIDGAVSQTAVEAWGKALGRQRRSCRLARAAPGSGGDPHLSGENVACGACTVIVGDAAVLACLMLTVQADRHLGVFAAGDAYGPSPARMAKRGKREFVQVLRLLEVFRPEDMLAGVREAIVRCAIGFDAQVAETVAPPLEQRARCPSAA